MQRFQVPPTWWFRRWMHPATRGARVLVAAVEEVAEQVEPVVLVESFAGGNRGRVNCRRGMRLVVIAQLMNPRKDCW